MKTTKLTILFALSIALVQTSSAQYAEDALRYSQMGLGVGSRTLGMGNAAVGTVSDYSSLFWNPAGLALQRNYEFSVGLNQQMSGNDVTFFGSTVNSTKNVTNLNNFGLVYPIATTRGSLTLAFGFGRVASYNGSAEFAGFNPGSSIVQSLAPQTNLNTMNANDRSAFLDNNIPFQIFLADTAGSGGLLYPLVTDSVNQSGTVLEGGGLNHWSLGGAVDVAKDLSLGISLNFVSGGYTYDRQYIEQDTRNIYLVKPFDFNKFTFQSNISSDISGFNALFGLMYRKQGKFKLGLSVRTPTTYEINETFTDDGRSWFKNGDTFHASLSNKTSYKVQTPLVLSGGVSVQPFDWLVIGGDAEYTDWTQMQFDSDNPDLIDENRYITQNFRATTNLRGGAEVTIWDIGLHLRGGMIWNPSPYKNDPSSFDQIYYTAGAGFDVENNVSINLAYAMGSWKTFRDNYFIAGLTSASTTSESVKTNNVNLTLSYRF